MVQVGGLKLKEVEEGRVVDGGRGRRHGDAKGIGGKATVITNPSHEPQLQISVRALKGWVVKGREKPNRRAGPGLWRASAARCECCTFVQLLATSSKLLLPL